MPSLSERLKAALPTAPDYELRVETSDVDRAAAVCAAVETFQAAEQAWEASSLGSADFDEVCVKRAIAKARLLEVNLG